MNAPLPPGALSEASRLAGDPAVLPDTLAECARAYEAKLQRLFGQLDPSWRRALAKRWPIVGKLDDPALVARCVIRLVYGRSPLKPPLLRLTDPIARLVLLDRAELLQRLCLLALSRRPGVLRCCIDRQAREALRAALGDAFEPARGLSWTGRAVPEAQAAFTPLHWACVGYTDWCLMMRPEDRALRRLVRLSLPRKILVKLVQDGPVDAEMSPQKGLARLEEVGVNWAC